MWGPSFSVDFPTPSRPSHHAWVLGHRPRGAQERRGEPGAQRLRDARLSTGFVWGHLPGKQLPPAETLLLLKAFLGLFKGDGTTSLGEGEPSSPLPFAGRCSTSSRPGRAHAGVAGPAPRSRARGRASGSRSPRARAWRVGSERRPGAERGEGCAARPGSRPLLAWPPALAGSWLQSAGPPRAGAELRTTPATQRPGAPERTRGAMRRQPATVAALLLGLLLEVFKTFDHMAHQDDKRRQELEEKIRRKEEEEAKIVSAAIAEKEPVLVPVQEIEIDSTTELGGPQEVEKVQPPGPQAPVKEMAHGSEAEAPGAVTGAAEIPREPPALPSIQPACPADSTH
ncbi:uncharacterized protein LOC144578335 [Callithrix jacchus]